MDKFVEIQPNFFEFKEIPSCARVNMHSALSTEHSYLVILVRSLFSIRIGSAKNCFQFLQGKVLRALFNVATVVSLQVPYLTVLMISILGDFLVSL